MKSGIHEPLGHGIILRIMRDQAEQLAAVTDKKNKTRACHRAGTILAFDFGLKRIGIAVGNLELGLAHPLSTISNESRSTCFSRHLSAH